MKNVLIQQAMEHQFSDYIARLGKEAGVGILVKELKPEEPGLEPVVGPEASTEKPGKKPEGKKASKRPYLAQSSGFRRHENAAVFSESDSSGQRQLFFTINDN